MRALSKIAAFLILFFLPSLANADELAKQKEALDAISEFANAICDKIPLEGESSTLAGGATANAEMNKLFSKLADLKLGGGVNYKSESYKNVVRQDLASALKDSRTCKQSIFRELKSDLLPKPGAALDGAARENLELASNHCVNGFLSYGHAILSDLNIKYARNSEVEAAVDECNKLAEEEANPEIGLMLSPGIYLSGKGSRPYWGRMTLYIDGHRCGILSNGGGTQFKSCGGLNVGEHTFQLKYISVTEINGTYIDNNGSCSGPFAVGKNVDKMGVIICMKRPYMNCAIIPVHMLSTYDHKKCKFGI